MTTSCSPHPRRVFLGIPAATVPAAGQATLTAQVRHPVRLGKLRVSDARHDALLPLRVAGLTVGSQPLLLPSNSDDPERMPPLGVFLPKMQTVWEAEIAAWCQAHPDADPDDAEVDVGGVSLDAMLHPGESLVLTLHNPTRAPIDVALALDGYEFPS